MGMLTDISHLHIKCVCYRYCLAGYKMCMLQILPYRSKVELLLDIQVTVGLVQPKDVIAILLATC